MAKKKKEETGLAVIQRLDAQVISIIGNGELQGFEKAFKVAEAIETLQTLLDAEYMRPIMKLQGNRLGFRTDRDKNDGYPEKVVKNCLIEAVLMGVQPVGNQFNIIANGPYITKEGFGYMLKKIPGLNYKIVHELPRVNSAATGAAVKSRISWQISGGDVKEQEIEMPIKVNSGQGTDAIIGKATRKARAWLYERLTGVEISDGDINDLDRLAPLAKKGALTEAQIEEADAVEEINRAFEFIKTAEDLKALESAEDFAFEIGGELLEAWKQKKKELNPNTSAKDANNN